MKRNKQPIMILKKHINKFLYSIFPSRPVSRMTVFFSFLTILCVIFILWNATRTGEQSGNLSSSITESIKDNIESHNSVPPSFEGTDAINSKSPTISEDSDKVSVNVYYLEIFIRKSAHLIEYTSLAFIAAITLFFAGVSIEDSFIKSVLFGIIIASTDEFLQSITEGRTGKLTDVLIDVCGCLMGAFIAISVFIFLYLLIKSKKTRGA